MDFSLAEDEKLLFFIWQYNRMLKSYKTKNLKTITQIETYDSSQTAALSSCVRDEIYGRIRT